MADLSAINYNFVQNTIMIKPYDLNTTILGTDLVDASTIAQLRTAITPNDRTHVCPQCDGQAYILLPNWPGPGDAPYVECPTCDGYGYTTVPYAAYCINQGFHPSS